jgi:hypothetical protein
MAACTFIPSPERIPEMPGTELWKLVDFKWLMAGQGWWVDLTRFRRDAAYAAQCLHSARSSRCAPLLQRADALAAALAQAPGPTGVTG